ncbi:HisA/HisF-related TIM barrel protein [Hyphomicrobium sp.]|uniref:HisA/HisF-related TIM barrel protein n=1 Tax=Hyphomicrobium sp. TaxID=82 RepID=UPI002C5BAA44|nr:HisA/HisF-related TIM barrel protein [Hyphomicrobium sp.]HRN88415.1 HisA/HisF-related TIM barrel protein [Hyphomicrobium sp.]HRQ27589.1 HisA/HisF-related TIM barrel protein [Hyphomicrobium sp.]
MRLIPVIDIRGGQAVAASRGDRANYRPLCTPLVEGSDPVAVALAFHALFPFPTLYVADLDGIEGRGADLATQARIADTWPGREIWIDDGGRSAGPLLPKQVPVFGSESFASASDYTQARAAAPAPALSLDFRGDTFLGPPELLVDASLWPDRIILMTLARVGSGEGPDIARLASIVTRAGAREVFAAGGVRNADDLRALRDIGVAGALVSTALHQGAITADDLDRLGVECDH